MHYMHRFLLIPYAGEGSFNSVWEWSHFLPALAVLNAVCYNVKLVIYLVKCRSKVTISSRCQSPQCDTSSPPV